MSVTFSLDLGNSTADSLTLGQLRAIVGTVPKPKVNFVVVFLEGIVIGIWP